MKIGCVGAGNIGRAVATVAVQRGYRAMLSNSRGPQTLAALAAEIGCETGTMEEAVAFGDLVLLAIPLRNYPALPVAPFRGKIVMDAGNYYPQRDGQIAALDAQSETTSGLLAQQLPGARIVKAFNAIFAGQIVTDAKLSGPRRALPIAGDDAEAKRAVTDFITALGFDVMDAGPLSESWRFERARPAYCIPMDKGSLEATLAQTTRLSFVPEGSWRR